MAFADVTLLVTPEVAEKKEQGVVKAASCGAHKQLQFGLKRGAVEH
jgi:hypothetical protein